MLVVGEIFVGDLLMNAPVEPQTLTQPLDFVRSPAQIFDLNHYSIARD